MIILHKNLNEILISIVVFLYSQLDALPAPHISFKHHHSRVV